MATSASCHAAASVYDDDPGLDDDAVVAWAVDVHRTLATNDKDFGDRVFRDNEPHAGVVLLRLDDERIANKIAVLRDLLRDYEQQLDGAFVVATEDRVRFV
ncbi:MAG: DUF5615 family PIN-like protein [Myxococcota bacterium]